MYVFVMNLIVQHYKNMIINLAISPAFREMIVYVSMYLVSTGNSFWYCMFPMIPAMNEKINNGHDRLYTKVSQQNAQSRHAVGERSSNIHKVISKSTFTAQESTIKQINTTITDTLSYPIRYTQARMIESWYVMIGEEFKCQCADMCRWIFRKNTLTVSPIQEDIQRPSG